jgi:hypothetical protein
MGGVASRARPWLWLTAGLVLVAAIGRVDSLTGYEYACSLF